MEPGRYHVIRFQASLCLTVAVSKSYCTVRHDNTALFPPRTSPAHHHPPDLGQQEASAEDEEEHAPEDIKGGIFTNREVL
ncbi:hypothetical protein LY78DRAFT_687412 [Colletotrichum sublineola]|nr:hypothetical protein LY78DRAFT_687412 [Colletotrichum sublineola]